MASLIPLEGNNSERLTSLVIQGLLLGANIAFFINDKGNIYTVISILFLISIFILHPLTVDSYFFILLMDL